MIPEPFYNQVETANYILNNDVVLNTSDPGTGKTRAALDGYELRKQAGKSKRLLVLAPKSLLQTAWGNDIEKFTPMLGYSIAWAGNRAEAFSTKTDIVITNHDAIKWVAENENALTGITDLIVDESTAFKNYTAQRSKALKKIAAKDEITFKMLMSGTLAPNDVTDIWHQAFILDNGQRLGTSFHRFRFTTCECTPKFPGSKYMDWTEKPGIREVVAGLLKDITIRYTLEECQDIPENFKTWIYPDIPPKIASQYRSMERDAILMTVDDKEVSAINKAVVSTKLLQILSGAIYEGKEYHLLDTSRYELVMDLIEARQQCLVAFLWKHQRDLLTTFARKAKMPFAVIDGETKDADKIRAVDDFQAGKLKVIFAHPQSASHGLTLTAGKHTIWASPTYNAEHADQFNRRIYRATQKDRTETVYICAKDSIEQHVYEAVLNPKLNKTGVLLSSLQQLAMRRSSLSTQQNDSAYLPI